MRTLAAVTLLRLRDRHGITGAFGAAVLQYGGFDLSMTPSQRLWGERNLVLSEPIINWFGDQFLPGARPRATPRPDISPLFAELSGMPPAIFTVGTQDPLLDDTLFMEARWRAAGHATELRVWPEAPHGFISLPMSVADVALSAEYDFLRRHAGRDRALAQLFQVRLDQPLRRPREPRLGDQLVQVLDRDALQAREDRRVAVEVWGREEDVRVIGEERLLGAEVLHAGTHDRSVGGAVPEGFDFPSAKGALPHEQLVLDTPLAPIARQALARLGQREREPADILPTCHLRTVASRGGAQLLALRSKLPWRMAAPATSEPIDPELQATAWDLEPLLDGEGQDGVERRLSDALERAPRRSRPATRAGSASSTARACARR